MITRRQAVKSVVWSAAAFPVAPQFSSAFAQPAAPVASPPGPFKLPPLPYAFDALEPHIDAKTMEIHHGRHHAAYVTNLNKAVAGQPALAKETVEDLVRDLNSLPESVRTAIRNHGGGHANHSFFWQIMAKQGGGAPKGEIARAIDKKFGSYAKFQDDFLKAALGIFGSGWTWLTCDSSKSLRIETTPNQNSPLSEERSPLLGLDVWEHAYYLKYQNKRTDYISAFYNVINWDFAAEQYKKLAG